ncbi:hypothetical protein AMS59_20380 [Lysinibacillus sp. FJAT-14745]|uniref:HEAT repeat domain-containing protein n=1 Tax=Lysinibacillus sp. FJAT-14745 TaxID=1704289 RepID=UPI0006ABB259|nr:HEAT repeat domain-containing protein [Lysinibacillus sp. FJAT-14745]KOP70191.1 hypothetical protein AMS59_20380 [Lysinibacillus sp. FJAT-14745]
MRELLIEIDMFRNWTRTTDLSFGEWETEYLHWDRIYYYVNKLIEGTPIEQWSSNLLNEFLYILARDNECEIIIGNLIANPKQLLSIAKYAVSFPDHDARWQIAYGLGEIDEDNEEIQMLINQFLLDEIEYVRKRALIAYEKKWF